MRAVNTCLLSGLNPLACRPQEWLCRKGRWDLRVLKIRRHLKGDLVNSCTVLESTQLHPCQSADPALDTATPGVWNGPSNKKALQLWESTLQPCTAITPATQSDSSQETRGYFNRWGILSITKSFPTFMHYKMILNPLQMAYAKDFMT